MLLWVHVIRESIAMLMVSEVGFLWYAARQSALMVSCTCLITTLLAE